ncbi:MAG TPA: MFS transporter, partial [Natronosporangium sp.]
MASAPAHGSPPAAPDPRRWRALTVCLVAGFMALLDVTIVNVALPSIEVGLDARDEDLQWIVSGYALAFGVVLGLAGRIGDARGRRRVFLVGVAAFTLASVASGLASTAGVLVATRAVQGLAGGVVTPQISGLIQQLFQGAERGRAFGWFGATVGVSTAVGPSLGGLLIHLGGPVDGWRWVFFVNVPIGVAAIALGARLLPPDARGQASRQRLDVVGMLLLGTGVLLVLVPVIEQQWRGPTRWLSTAGGIAVLAGFWAWERRYARTGEPAVDVGLFRRRSYALGCLLGMFYFAGFTAVPFVLSLFLQQGHGYSALATGLTLTPFALGSAVAAAASGRVVTRIGRPLVAAGLVTVGVGVAATAVVIELVPGRSASWAVAPALLLAGLGSGMVISPNVTLTLSEVPVRRAGSAGGVLQTAQRVGSATGIA